METEYPVAGALGDAGPAKLRARPGHPRCRPGLFGHRLLPTRARGSRRTHRRPLHGLLPPPWRLAGAFRTDLERYAFLRPAGHQRATRCSAAKNCCRSSRSRPVQIASRLFRKPRGLLLHPVPDQADPCQSCSVVDSSPMARKRSRRRRPSVGPKLAITILDHSSRPLLWATTALLIGARRARRR